MSAPLLWFDAVCVHDPDYAEPLLEFLRLQIRAGEAVALVGPSGSGKSTALALALGESEPTAGAVQVLAWDPRALDRAGLRELRLRVGHLPQQGGLLSNLTLADNIALPLLFHRRLEEGAARHEVRALCRLLDLHELPAVMPALAPPLLRQAVALARALILQPTLLLIDEPDAGLGGDAQEDWWRLLWRVQQELGVAMLVATADREHVQILTGTVVPLQKRRTATFRLL